MILLFRCINRGPSCPCDASLGFRSSKKTERRGNACNGSVIRTSRFLGYVLKFTNLEDTEVNYRFKYLGGRRFMISETLVLGEGLLLEHTKAYKGRGSKIDGH